MHIINQQYVIMHSIPTELSDSLYEAKDLHQDGRVVRLRILEHKAFQGKIGCFYNELIGLQSLVFPGIPEMYAFGAVQTVDGVSPPHAMYYCAFEKVTGTPLLAALDSGGLARTVSLFMQVIHTVTYLHDRGYVHGNLEADCLLVQDCADGPVIKFRGFVLSGQLERLLYPRRANHSQYRAPEWYVSYAGSVKGDYYALGVLLFQMIAGSEETNDFAHRLEAARRNCAEASDGRSARLCGLLEIISRLTEQDPDERYAYLYEVVMAVNAVMGSNYPKVRTEYTERFVNNFPLIGRKELQEELLAGFEQAWNGKERPRVALLTGEAGIGKTRMLEELNMHLHLDRLQVFEGGSADLGGAPFAKLVPVVRLLIQKAPRAIVDQYSTELVKLAPDEPKLQGVQPSAALEGDKERIRLRVRLTHFVKDALAGKPAIILIDDAHSLDAGALDWLDYVLGRTADLPLFFVLACRDHDLQKHEGELLHDFKRWRTAGMAAEFRLGRFNEEETGLMVKSMLGMNRIPRKFASRIYQESQGNPAFIKHALLALHMEKRLYVNEWGRWSTDFDGRGDYSVLPLPISVDDAIMKQIDSLGEAAYRLLEFIAIGQGDVPLPMLERLNGSSGLSFGLQELMTLQLIDRQETEQGDSFAFRSNMVKKAVYGRLHPRRKLELHRQCADELGRSNDPEDNKSRLERMHHLLQLKDYRPVLALIFDIAGYYMHYYMREQALVHLHTGLWAAEELDDADGRMRIQYLMGEVYLGQGDNELALECFNASLRFAAELRDIGMEIDIKCKLADLYLRKNERVPVETLITDAIESSLASKYKKGLLEALSLYIRVADSEAYQEKLARIGQLITPEDEAQYPEQLAKFYKAQGLFYLQQAQYKEAEEAFQMSVELFRALNKVEDYSNNLTNLGVLAVLYKDDIALARRYFEEALEGSLRSGSPHAVTHYCNLLEICATEDRLAEAVDYLKLGETLANEYDFTLRIMGLSISGLHLYTQLSDYQRAYKYLLKAKEYTNEQGPDSSWVMPEFHERASFFYYVMGGWEQAQHHAEEGYLVSQEYHSAEKMYCSLLQFLIRAQREGRLDRERLEQLHRELRASKHVRMFRYFLHSCAELLFDLGGAEEAGRLLAESAELAERADSARLGTELMWLEGRREGGASGIAKLTQAIGQCEACFAESIAWKAYTARGAIYESLGEWQQARSDYVLALDALYKLTETVPEPFRISFLKAHGREKPRARLLRIAARIEQGIDGGAVPGEAPYTAWEEDQTYFQGLGESVWIESEADAAARAAQDMALIGAVLSSQSDSYERNLHAIAEAACRLTQADCGCFILPDENGSGYRTFGTTAGLAQQEHLLMLAKEQRNGFYTAQLFGEWTGLTGIRLPMGIRAVMCVPIYGQDQKETASARGRQTAAAVAPRGYLYLEAHSVLHRFRQESFEQARRLAQLGLLSIENYRLQITSSIDKLTGAYTRKYFESVQQRLVEESMREGRSFAVLLSDIDRFKSVNDNYGHRRGDDILREVGRLFREGLREGDICCRYGGEEFIFLLPGANAEEAALIAERLRGRVEEAKLLGASAALTVSVGIAAYPKQGRQWEELKERADQALYHAKEHGRNRVSLWEETMRTTAKRVDQLAGIVMGNLVADQRNVLVMLEFIQLLNEELGMEETMYRMLGRVMEILEADEGVVLLNGGGREERAFARKRYKEGWTETPAYNQALVRKVKETKTGAYLIDWELSREPARHEEPVWHSVMLVPLIRGKEVQGVLLLSAPIASKEYGFNDFNYLDKLGELFAAVLGSGKR